MRLWIRMELLENMSENGLARNAEGKVSEITRGGTRGVGFQDAPHLDGAADQ